MVTITHLINLEVHKELCNKMIFKKGRKEMYEITYIGENIIEGGIHHINFIKEVLRIKDFNEKDGVYQNDLQQEILITEVK